jgi:hypothetical protein
MFSSVTPDSGGSKAIWTEQLWLALEDLQSYTRKDIDLFQPQEHEANIRII